MNAISLNNLWSYIQGLSLTSNNQRWLAQRLIEASSAKTKTEDENAKMQKLNALFGALNNVDGEKMANAIIEGRKADYERVLIPME